LLVYIKSITSLFVDTKFAYAKTTKDCFQKSNKYIIVA
jgi:hypothetical protein